MTTHDILVRSLAHARHAAHQSDLGDWSRRVESGIRLEAERRSAGRPIRRRGSRASMPARDRLCERWCD